MVRTKKKAAKKSAKSKTLVVVTASPARKKHPPSTTFKPGNPYRFEKGVSGNPSGGSPKSEMRLVTKALLAMLPNRATAVVTKALGLPSHASWATCIAQQLITAAVSGDTSAAAQIIATTEGTRSRLDVFQENIGSAGAPPIFEIVFVEAIDGKPAPGITIEGRSAAVPPALPAAT